jgi:hypothetical protein
MPHVNAALRELSDAVALTEMSRTDLIDLGDGRLIKTDAFRRQLMIQPMVNLEVASALSGDWPPLGGTDELPGCVG